MFVFVPLLPLAICVIASMVIGFLWYSPMLFAKPWMRMVGIQKTSKEEMQKTMPRALAVSVISAIVMTIVTGQFIVILNVAGDPLTGAYIGFLCWLGFTATTFATSYVYTQKPLALYAIDAGYPLVTSLSIGAILAAMV